MLHAYTLLHVGVCVGTLERWYDEPHQPGSTVAPLTSIEQAVTADTVSPQMWLDDVYVHVAKNETDAASDLLYDHVDDLLLAGSFSECDDLLLTIDLARLDTFLMIAALSITKAAAEELRNRASFVEHVERRLQALAPDRVEALLRNLR